MLSRELNVANFVFTAANSVSEAVESAVASSMAATRLSYAELSGCDKAVVCRIEVVVSRFQVAFGSAFQVRVGIQLSVSRLHVRHRAVHRVKVLPDAYLLCVGNDTVPETALDFIAQVRYRLPGRIRAVLSIGRGGIGSIGRRQRAVRVPFQLVLNALVRRFDGGLSVSVTFWSEMTEVIMSISEDMALSNVFLALYRFVLGSPSKYRLSYKVA